jgi:hypothetical protein
MIFILIYDNGSTLLITIQLMSFGIPVNVLPVTDDGERKTANHSKWLSRRKAKEEALATSGSFQGIDLPGKFVSYCMAVYSNIL